MIIPNQFIEVPYELELNGTVFFIIILFISYTDLCWLTRNGWIVMSVIWWILIYWVFYALFTVYVEMQGKELWLSIDMQI